MLPSIILKLWKLGVRCFQAYLALLLIVVSIFWMTHSNNNHNDFRLSVFYFQKVARQILALYRCSSLFLSFL